MKCALCGKTDQTDDEELIDRKILWWTLGPAHFCSQLCFTYFKCPTQAQYLSYIKESPVLHHPPVDKKDWNVLKTAIYEPNYNHAISEHFTSYRDEQKKIKRWNERQDGEKHPRKFQFANDDHKLMADCKQRSKDRESYKEHIYRDQKYKAGDIYAEPSRRKRRGTAYSFPTK